MSEKLKMLCPRCEWAEGIRVKKNWDAHCAWCLDRIGKVYNYK
jgi:hypothetical protein